MSNFEYFGGVEGYFYFFLLSHLLCDQNSWYDIADTPYFIHHNLIFYMSLVFATRILRFWGLSAHNKVHVCEYEFTLLQSSSGEAGASTTHREHHVESFSIILSIFSYCSTLSRV